MKNLFTCMAIIFASLLLLIFFPVGDNPGNNSIYLTSGKADIYRDMGVGEAEPFRDERVRDSIFASNAPVIGGTISDGGYYMPYAKIVNGNTHMTQLSYYVQTRGSWASTILNHPSTNATFKTAGCGYTSMAMAISSITNNSSFTPLSLNPILGTTGNNICTSGVYSWNGMPFYMSLTGLNNDWQTIYTGEELTADKIRTTIYSGGFMIVRGGALGPYTTGGHMLILCGYTTDEYGNFKELIIQDPNVTGGISSGRYASVGKNRIRVDQSDWRVYDNILSTTGYVRSNDLIIATAHIPR